MDLLYVHEWFRLLLKATFGSGLFALILWCAQNRNPRAAGMMLTFPAVNGIGLLTAETDGLDLMVQAMSPMIALNGLLCAAYILVQRQLPRQVAGVPPLRYRLGVLGVGLLLWGSVAAWIAPGLQTHLDAPGSMLAFVGGYAACSVLVTARVLWCPTTAQGAESLSFTQILRHHALRVGSVFGFLILIMLCARYGAEAWAGRLSALPVLPFYSLLLLSSMPANVSPGPSRLEQIGSTALAGPLIAITFAWAYASYLQTLRATVPTVLSTLLAGIGLLTLWGLCGLAIWALLYLARRLETRSGARAVSQG